MNSTRTMKAVVYDGSGGVRVDELPRPRPQADADVVLEVSLTSICGSDLHLLDGKTPGMREGSVIGHEYVGTVAEAGPGAGFSEGDRVLGSFLIVCGTCFQCRAGRFNFCRDRRALGLGALTGDLDGAQAEYVRVPNAPLNLKRVPDGTRDEDVLFAGDILATGFYAVAASGIGEGDRVVVIGAGPVGLCCAFASQARGADIVVVDQDLSRLAFAQRIGFETIDASSEVADELNVRTGGEMADVVIDAVGAVAVVKSALRCVRDGGRVTVAGVYGTERYDLPMGVAWVRGIDLLFTGMANVQGHWDAALEDIREGSIDPTKLITHRLALDHAVEGYELFRSREAMKVVLDPRA